MVIIYFLPRLERLTLEQHQAFLGVAATQQASGLPPGFLG